MTLLVEPDLRFADSLVELERLPPGSIDACVTDPPYFIGLLDHDWDEVGEPREIQAAYERWAKLVLRALKPGAFLVSFGSTLTSHRMVCAFEDAGFELRDTLCWIHQGHPHGMNLSKAIDREYFEQWLEQKGILLPAKERRALSADYSQGRLTTPLFKDFLSRHEGLLPPWGSPERVGDQVVAAHESAKEWQGYRTDLKPSWEPIVLARKPLEGTVVSNALKFGVGALNVDACGIPVKDSDDSRYPANVLVEPGGSVDRDVVVVEGSSTPAQPDHRDGEKMDSRTMGWRFRRAPSRLKERIVGDGLLGPATRFFVIPKPSGSEKDEGLPAGLKNKHPSVKPVALMHHLIRMVVPRGGVCLDPFMGSGTTGVACVDQERAFIGFDNDQKSFDTARLRIDHRLKNHDISAESILALLPDEE